MMDRLLAPSSVAIVGLSADTTKHGARVLANLRKVGFAGEIWGVNPSRPDIEGVDVVASLADMPHPPDVAVCAVPGARVPNVVRDAAGTGVVVVFAGGFAEAGPEGAALQAELGAAAAASGVRVLGPNSGGVIAPDAGVALSFLTCLDRPSHQIGSGPVGLVTQSGGTGSHLHNLAFARGSGFAASISTGNEADIDISESIEALAQRNDVAVVAVVLETIRDGARFMEAIDAVHAMGKRVVALRIGRSRRGSAMTVTHTGTLATPDRVFDGVGEALGVVRAETPGELLDIAEILARTPKASGRSVGMVTHSGGIGILLADLAEHHGLELDQPSPELVDEVRPLLHQGSPANPLDMGGIIGGPHRFAEVVGRFAAAYDSVLAVSTAHPPDHSEARAESLLALETSTPIVHLWMAGDVATDALQLLRTGGAPVTEEPRSAVAAMAALHHTPRRPFEIEVPAIAEPAGRLTEHRAKGLLGELGIPTVTGAVATSAAAAVEIAGSLGYPVVAKIDAPGLVHKTEVGGVVLGIEDAGAMRRAWGTLTDAAATAGIVASGVLVEEMRAGPEALIGFVRDATFGPMVAIGIGGVTADAISQSILVPAEFDMSVAESMLRRLRAIRLLTEPRSGHPADLGPLVELAARLGAAGFANAWIEAVDVNPIVWTDAGWVALDATVVH